MEMIDISLSTLALLYTTLLLPLWLIYRYTDGLLKDAAIAVVRMTVQLVFVGVYLKYILEWNHFWLNTLWILVMLAIANTTTLSNAGLRKRKFFLATFFGISLSTLSMTAILLLIVIEPDPLYDARYLIPLTGMILGNSLRGNVLALERFYSAIRKNETEFMTYLMMGATLKEAIRPYMRDAVKASLSPIVATMATVGLWFPCPA
ncbi:ABC transporter permease [Chloroherpeton thalassium]|uniref:ABC transporter permease n=1 Tax=Chloroherpeton thalassium TaxID=100716 RepID=UPI0002EB2760|nr:ABC transporter permease [Chloroherpeton thalassium]